MSVLGRGRGGRSSTTVLGLAAHIERGTFFKILTHGLGRACRRLARATAVTRLLPGNDGSLANLAHLHGGSDLAACALPVDGDAAHRNIEQEEHCGDDREQVPHAALAFGNGKSRALEGIDSVGDAHAQHAAAGLVGDLLEQRAVVAHGAELLGVRHAHRGLHGGASAVGAGAEAEVHQIRARFGDGELGAPASRASLHNIELRHFAARADGDAFRIQIGREATTAVGGLEFDNRRFAIDARADRRVGGNGWTQQPTQRLLPERAILAPRSPRSRPARAGVGGERNRTTEAVIPPCVDGIDALFGAVGDLHLRESLAGNGEDVARNRGNAGESAQRARGRRGDLRTKVALDDQGARHHRSLLGEDLRQQLRIGHFVETPAGEFGGELHVGVVLRRTVAGDHHGGDGDL